MCGFVLYGAVWFCFALFGVEWCGGNGVVLSCFVWCGVVWCCVVAACNLSTSTPQGGESCDMTRCCVVWWGVVLCCEVNYGVV